MRKLSTGSNPLRRWRSVSQLINLVPIKRENIVGADRMEPALERKGSGRQQHAYLEG